MATAACDVQVGQDGGLSFDVASGRAQDTWTRSYTLASGGRLELINVNGRISAEPSSGTEVELAGERIAKASSDEAAQELLGKVEMREETSASQVRVEVRSPRTFGFGGLEVRWTVKVPKGVVVDLRNDEWQACSLTGLTGEVHARTVNGGVTGRGLAVQILEASDGQRRRGRGDRRAARRRCQVSLECRQRRRPAGAARRQQGDASSPA